MDPSFIIIALITVVIGLAIAVYFNSKGGIPLIHMSRSGSQIVIVGEMGAGKTAFFEFLKSGRKPQTVHSLQVNRAEVVAEPLGLTKPYQFVDIPGHGSFRGEYDKSFPQARAILFFIDAQNDLRVNESALHLYTILTSRIIVKRNVPVIIVCSKSDTAGALSSNRMKTLLEAGLEKIRKSRAGSGGAFIAAAGRKSGLDDEEDGPTPILGKPLTGPDSSDAPFTFEDTSNPVKFASISVKEGKLSSLGEVLQSVI